MPAPKPNESRIGRNAPCPCGSGKKWKKCCAGKKMVARIMDENQKVRILNQNGLNAVLFNLIEGLGGSITIPLSVIRKVTTESKFQQSYNAETETFTIATSVPEQSIIVTLPEKRLIV